MRRLFEESAINQLTLKNRFVRAATWEGLATAKGEVTPALVEMMVSLARGGVGLIISSHTYVSPEGQGTPWQMGIYNDRLIAGLQELTTAVHAHGGKIVMQLTHAGLYAEVSVTGQAAMVVSDNGQFPEKDKKVMTLEDIERMISAFASGARRALAAGFDGVEIHSGHGYFLSQFLSPIFNRRQDAYGGSIENRTRIHLQICDAVRAVVGKDYPVLIKMNSTDLVEGGLTPDDGLQAAKRFCDAGFDAIEVSGGIIRTGRLSPSKPGINTESREAYFKEYARGIKAHIKTPLILVGGLRSYPVAEKIIAEGIADYISMSRPLIREPDLINRWQKGDQRRSQCTSDNLCFNPGLEGKGVFCVTREIENNKKVSPGLTAKPFS